jgi:AraC-like DNA-binding protein
MDLLDYNLQLCRARFGYPPPNWVWDSDTFRLQALGLFIIKKGGGELKTSSKTYKFKTGDCFFLHPDEHFQVYHKEMHSMEVNLIVFDFLDNSKNIFIPDTSILPKQLSIQDLPLIVKLSDKCIIAINENNMQYAKILMRCIIAELMKNAFEQKKSDKYRMQRNLIDEICKEIYEHPNKIYKCKDLAKRCYCCHEHFIRIFKEYKKVTPKEFIIRARINYAQDLLRFSNYNLAEIASQLKYCDQFAFSKQFKKNMGISPKQYREGSS